MRRSPQGPLGEAAIRELVRLTKLHAHPSQIAERLDCTTSTIVDTRHSIAARGLETVLAERRGMKCRETVFREITIQPSDGRPCTYDTIQAETARALRPRHVEGPICSPEWWKSCDDAFGAAMRLAIHEYAAERNAIRAVIASGLKVKALVLTKMAS